VLDGCQSFTAEIAKNAEEQKNFTAKNAKAARKITTFTRIRLLFSFAAFVYWAVRLYADERREADGTAAA